MNARNKIYKKMRRPSTSAAVIIEMEVKSQKFGSSTKRNPISEALPL
jgi:hypothetical protein